MRSSGRNTDKEMEGMKMKKKIVSLLCAAGLMVSQAVPVLAAPSGDVSGVIEQTWTSAATPLHG